MTINRRRLFAMIGTLSVMLGMSRGPRLLAQEGTPAPEPAATPVGMTTAVLIDAQQRRVGTATVSEAADGQMTLSVSVEEDGLPPGVFHLVLHETGICQASDSVAFSSAGGLDPNGPQDVIATISIAEGEAADLETTVDANAMAALNDRDGSALVFHAGSDDEENLDGDVGRVACGVIYPPTEVAAAATPSASPTTTPDATPGATPGAATDVTVEMVDIDFNPNEFTIPANTDVVVHLPNLGAIVHNFHIDALDVHSEDVQPGNETTVTINADPGDYEYYCSIPGHRQAGMVGTVHVE